MAAVSVEHHERPSCSSSSCAACGAFLSHQSDSGAVLNHLSDTRSIKCTACETELCSGCHSLKQRLEPSSDRLKRSSDLYCVPCQEVREIIKNGARSSNQNSQRQSVAHGSLEDGSRFPVKSPRVNLGKRPHLQNDSVTETLHNDQYSDKEVMHFSRSSEAKLANFSSMTSNKNTTRFRIKRNERGLASMSDVPNVIDNRYLYLNAQWKLSDETVNAMENVYRTNVQPAVRRGNYTEPSTPGLKWRSSMTNKRHGLYPEMENDDDYHWDGESGEGVFNRYPFKDELSNRSSQIGQGVHEDRQYSTHQNSEIDKTAADSYLQEEADLSAQQLPPDSQFFAETIRYPTSGAGYPSGAWYQSTPQRPSTNVRYNKQHSRQTSRLNSYPNTNQRHTPGNGYSKSQSYSTHQSQYTYPNSSNQRRANTSSMSTHTGKLVTGSSQSSHSKCNEFLDDTLLDQEENLDDLDDVPAYDEIPYALLITGSVDDKTLRRAKSKQQQQLAFDIFKGKSGKATLAEKVNINKNQGSGFPKGKITRQDTHREQLAASRKQVSTNTAVDDFNAPIRHASIWSEHGKENLQEKKTNQTPKYLQTQLDDLSRCQEVNMSDERTLKNLFEERESLVTSNGESRKHPEGGTNLSRENQHDERANSIIEILHHDQNSNEMQSAEDEMQVEKNHGIVEDIKEIQPHSVKPTEELIRKKRLEKLIHANPDAGLKKISHDIMQKRKPDNREVSFNKEDVKSKPVKPLAFRNRLPKFKVKEIPEDVARQSPELEEKEFCAPDTSKAVGTESKSSDINAEKTLQLSTIQDQKLTEINQTHSFDKRPSHGLEKRNNETENWSLSLSETNTGEDDKPSAMKLLRRKEFKQPAKIKETVDDIGYSNQSDDDEEWVEPIAMRLLREIEEDKEDEAAISGVIFHSGASSPSDLVSLLSTVFGIVSQKRRSKDSKRKSLVNGQTSETKSKQTTNNKNKNLTPKQGKRNEKSANQTEEKTNMQALKQQHAVTSAKSSETNVSITVKTLTSELDSADQIAENRHRAFQKLKMSQSEDLLKCTSCGRPDCKSQNVQKMKEIISMAKQAGFDVRDVTPDGNCMFAAVVDQLQLYGDLRFGPKSLRQAAVTWLIEHPLSDDGTHYSSFMSEEWDVYLQRMMVEGEWGDHVVLRAVVETVGHTIKILNISGDESHWTILEPASIDASRDGIHLVLGHVGEFHYTSLRPADGHSSFVSVDSMSPGDEGTAMTKENGQIALEGSETIEMFREDYIDTWSDLPTAHFSYLLKHVIPLKVVDTAAILQSQFTSELPSKSMKLTAEGKELETTLEAVGGIYEGVYVPSLHVAEPGSQYMGKQDDSKYVGIIKCFRVLEETSRIEPREWNEIALETTGVHVGYTKLLRAQNIQEGEDGSYMYQPHLTNTNDSARNDSSPLCAISYPFWPKCAQSWTSRMRCEGFPPQEMISILQSEGCLLLPNSHKSSKCPFLEWQFSFILCEKKLFKESVSSYQKYCFILFDALCRQTMHHLDTISVGLRKNVFFYACERIPAEYWESTPGACVLYMLNELLRYMRNKHLPNYFVEANNMVDHLLEKDFNEIEEQIILLCSQLELFLREIDDILRLLPNGNEILDKVFNDVMQYKVHRSLKQSTLEVFVPSTIVEAHHYIKKRMYADGYEILLQAFQERLSVSTCDDSVPFQIFIPGAVSGLDLDSLVWFSAYMDKQLEGQLSKSLVRETCGDLNLVKIKDVLPADVVGSYGNTEIPVEFSQRLCSFCYDFARFLYQTNKLSEVLPVLYHCVDIYKKKSEHPNFRQTNEDKYKGEQTEMEDFDDESMLNIYTAMYHTYRQQRQFDFIRKMIPDIEVLVQRINKRWAYYYLCSMYSFTQDKFNHQKSSMVYQQLPEDPTEQMHIKAFMSWVKR